MGINILQSSSGWIAEIDANDTIVMRFNGSDLAVTSTTVQTGYKARIELRYQIIKL